MPCCCSTPDHDWATIRDWAFLWTRAVFWHKMATVQAANVTTTVP